MKTIFFLITLFCSPVCFSLGAKTNLYNETLEPLEKGHAVHIFPLIHTEDVSGFDAQDVLTELHSQLEKLKYNVTSENKVSFSEQLTYAPPNLVEKVLWGKSFYQDQMAQYPEHEGIFVFPTIIVRVANLQGSVGKWDGVRQTIRITGREMSGEWSGKHAAYSMRLEVLDHKGNWLMTTYGGVSFPFTADAVTSRFVQKDRLFEHKKDLKSMKKGVKKALWPFKKHFDF